MGYNKEDKDALIVIGIIIIGILSLGFVIGAGTILQHKTLVTQCTG